ncbi:MAG: 2-isopropylmalate synthase [Clostridiales bacterium]|jgi:2-isopropylmalate synthase|nr:2-isopropylmalate synthase [Clostridiales bacterium]
MNYAKYRPIESVELADRRWPGNRIACAPIWCSVDLRDGNQALEIPMTLNQKLEFFKFLADTGFKQIEIGFPAASETEFSFTRALIEGGLIPDDVVIQVLTQSREHIIKRTFDAVAGASKAIIHLYNSTSTLQREVVFEKSRQEIIGLAVEGAKLVEKLAEERGREHFIFEYSPESFSGTEMDYAVEVCDAVLDVWKPTPQRKAIINLPNTVEMATPNVYADQIEYAHRHIKRRDSIIISLHTHNDRGTAVACTELALLAGADRVEGTLFGNGERTGNADIMNIAMNMYANGIDPRLDFSHIDEMISVYEKSTNLYVHPRHPYAGSLVYTAFSGSHQDAINKGMQKMKTHPDLWAVPYLTIDPKDVGRTYDPIIRINSQSGKGGVAYILENSYGIKMPKSMQQHFGAVATQVSDEGSKELLPEELYKLFDKEYVNIEAPICLVKYNETANGETSVDAKITDRGEPRLISGIGDGILDAFCKGIRSNLGVDFEIISYSEHSLEYSSKSRAITYVEISDASGRKFFGAGISSSISKSSLRAVVSAVNKILRSDG